MIAPDVLRAIRARDADVVTYRGKAATCAQMDRRDLLAELDAVTKERDRLAAELAATKIVSVRVGV